MLHELRAGLENDVFIESRSSLLHGYSDELQVYIGNDSNFDHNATVIKRTYKKDGNEGVIAIIGPKRMEYERVESLINYMVDKIEGRK